MTAQQAIQLVLQLLALFPSVEPSIVKAIQDFEALFASGAAPTQAQIDALIGQIKTQSAVIQSL